MARPTAKTTKVKSFAGDPRADLTVLDRYATKGFLPGFPADRRIFFSPVDELPDVLKHCISSAEHDVDVCMYGFDDDALVDILLDKMQNEHVNVQLVLDKSQAGGVHERKLLDVWRKGAPATSIVIGQSERHAIQHLKCAVIDGLLSISGSTNWSDSGETKQDNVLDVTLSFPIAVQLTHRIRAIRLAMEQQQKG